ncbi:MAG: tRNA lysidine(34) synthetase TilS [Clostridia bacterium]|nr:tRNA lysidine(34) synthetase TilS [Clostridia bacterium]
MTEEEFSTRLSQDCGFMPGSHVLVALSGGADSVALLCLFLRAQDSYPLRVSCAHVEHGIRGAASLDDLAFVRALCKEKNVPLYTAQVDAPAYSRMHGCGVEDAARTLRHDFLRSTMERIGAHAVALAHHRCDQAETVLLHAMRGSDMRGLCAMRFQSGHLIRPLLGEQPQQLRAYLQAIGQPWREDETNADTVYLRNRVRHEILPRMEAGMPGSGEALCRLARAAQRDEDYFAAQIDALDIPVIALTDGAAVPRRCLAGLHPAVLSRVLTRLIDRHGFGPQRCGVIEAVMDALKADEAVINLTRGAHASVGRRYLCLTHAHVPVTDTPLCVPGVTDTPFGRFEVYPAPEGETGDGKCAQRIPAKLLEGAYVSARREADMMIPFGRKTPVRLKKLMIDAGVERAMRPSVPIVRAGDGSILFAAGLRPAECCRSEENTQQMIVRFAANWPCAGMQE